MNLSPTHLDGCQVTSSQRAYKSLFLLLLALFQAKTRTLWRTRSSWKQSCWRVSCGRRCSVVATSSSSWNDLSPDDMSVAFDFHSQQLNVLKSFVHLF